MDTSTNKHSKSNDTRSSSRSSSRKKSAPANASATAEPAKAPATAEVATKGKGKGAEKLLSQISAITEAIERKRPSESSDDTEKAENSQKRNSSASAAAGSSRAATAPAPPPPPPKRTRLETGQGSSSSRSSASTRPAPAATATSSAAAASSSSSRPNAFRRQKESKEVVLQQVDISWGRDVHKFVHPKDTKFSVIRMELAERIPIRPDNLLILDDMNEVPDSLPICEIPATSELESFESADINTEGRVTVDNLRPEYILIRLQGTGCHFRKQCKIAMKRATYFKQLIQDFITKFKLDGKNFKVIFKGRDLASDKSPGFYRLNNNDLLFMDEI